MVSTGYMRAAALRQNTAMARAMLRALGVPRPWRFGASSPLARGMRRDSQRYEGLMECFRNPTSPMDWPRA